MNLRPIFVLVVLLAACGGPDGSPSKCYMEPAAASLTAPAPTTGEDRVAGSYIVAFRSERSQQAYGSYSEELQLHDEDLLSLGLLADPGVKEIRYIDHVDLAAPDALLEPVPNALASALRFKAEPVMAALAQVDFTTEDDAGRLLGLWEASGQTWFAEPNYLNRLQGVFADAAARYAQPTLWWHEQINLAAAFNWLETRPANVFQSDAVLTQAAGQPVVAIFDSGLDVTHPAFKDRLWEKPGSNKLCPDDRYGCDTTKARKGTLGKGDVTPYAVEAAGTCPALKTAAGGATEKEIALSEDQNKNCGHGTHVAGIVAGNYDGKMGGICPICRVMAIKIIARGKDGMGGASDSAILNGFKYLLTIVQSSGGSVVRVVNSSFGKYQRSRAIALLVSKLKGDPHRILVVGAAGNEDSLRHVYPAALEEALGVSALDERQGKASYSNFGSWVDVAAPGGDRDSRSITSAIPGGITGDKAGTSMAAPIVAGLAGLILAVDPERPHHAVKAGIVQGANGRIYEHGVSPRNHECYNALTGEGGERVPLLGSGIVDAKAAIAGEPGQAPHLPRVIKRVQRGCSTVALGEPGGAASGVLLALVPLLALLLGSANGFRRRRVELGRRPGEHRLYLRE